MIIDHGTFALYAPPRPSIPARPSNPAEEAAWASTYATELHLIRLLDAKVKFLKNAANVDWYSLAQANPNKTFAMVRDGRVVAVSSDPSTLWPIDCRVVETDGAVEVGYAYVNGALAPYVPSLAEAKAAKIAAAWAECTRRVEAGSVSVTTSAGTHTYGIDRTSQENIKAVLLGVLLGATPNPRPWTPRGATAPIQLTHADLGLVGATMMASVDAHVQAYLTHKAIISLSATVEAIQARDLSLGWP